MKKHLMLSIGALVATIISTTISAEAGWSRYGGHGGYGRPVVVAPPPSYHYRPQYNHYAPPVVASRGWGWDARPATRCETTAYRGYGGYGRGYTEYRETTCRPTYYRPTYRPPCPPPSYHGHHGGGHYRGSSGGVWFRF